MTQSRDRAGVQDESTADILRSTLDLVDQVVNQITPEDVEESLAALLRQAATSRYRAT